MHCGYITSTMKKWFSGFAKDWTMGSYQKRTILKFSFKIRNWKPKVYAKVSFLPHKRNLFHFDNLKMLHSNKDLRLISIEGPDSRFYTDQTSFSGYITSEEPGQNSIDLKTASLHGNHGEFDAQWAIWFWVLIIWPQKWYHPIRRVYLWLTIASPLWPKGLHTKSSSQVVYLTHGTWCKSCNDLNQNIKWTSKYL